MPSSIRSKFTFANLIALVALFAAIGGTAFAVTKAPKNSVTTKSIKNGAVKSKKLADGSVSGAKLSDGSVVSAKLADGAVVSAKLADGSVLSGKLAEQAVTGEKIADGAVSGEKLGADSVTTEKIAQGAVTNTDLAQNSVSVGKIEPAAITAQKFYRAQGFVENFPSVPANDCTATTDNASFADLQATDRIFVGTPSGLPAPLVVKGSTAGGNLTVTICNLSNVDIDPGSFSYPLLVLRAG